MPILGPRMLTLTLCVALTTVWPATALAEQPTSAIISDGTVSFEVSKDAGLTSLDTGLIPAPGDGQKPGNACACTGWAIANGDSVLSPLDETFSTSGTEAMSTVDLQDAATGTQVRVTHEVLPITSTGNEYEVIVTIQNTGTNPVQPSYVRELDWAGTENQFVPIDPSIATLSPTADGSHLQFQVAIPPTAPGATQSFRLLFGAGATTDDADQGLVSDGATLVSHSRAGSRSVAFGYAPVVPTTVTGRTDGETGLGAAGSGGPATGGGGTYAGFGGRPVDSGAGGAETNVARVNGAVARTDVRVASDAVDHTSDVVTTSQAADHTDAPAATGAAGPQLVSASNLVAQASSQRQALADNVGPVAPDAQATPELRSVMLLATALGGYALFAWRSRRRNQRAIRDISSPDSRDSEV